MWEKVVARERVVKEECMNDQHIKEEIRHSQNMKHIGSQHFYESLALHNYI